MQRSRPVESRIRVSGVPVDNGNEGRRATLADGQTVEFEVGPGRKREEAKNACPV